MKYIKERKLRDPVFKEKCLEWKRKSQKKRYDTDPVYRKTQKRKSLERYYKNKAIKTEMDNDNLQESHKLVVFRDEGIV
jgi:hypothetical protein